MSLFLRLKTKEHNLKNDWNFGTIDFLLWKSVVFHTFFKISSFWFSRRKTQ